MSLGSRLADLRKSQGVTQAALAKKTGLSASAIAMYETNRRAPDHAAIAKLCDALSVSHAALLCDEQPETPGSMASEVKDSTPPSTVQTDAGGYEPEHKHGHAEVRESHTSAAASEKQLTQLALSREEARIILFLRMNPMCMPFVESYTRAGAKQREQLAKTWRLIHDFQGQSTV